MTTPTHFYEILDVTDDEYIKPVACYLTLEECHKMIKKCDELKESVSEDPEDYEKLHINTRKFGAHYTLGDTVETIERMSYYDEEADEYYWKRA